MNIEAIRESLANIYKCLDKISDETEVRPGEKTIRGTDAGVIEVAEILHAIDVARSDCKDIEKELEC